MTNEIIELKEKTKKNVSKEVHEVITKKVKTANESLLQEVVLFFHSKNGRNFKKH